MSFQEIARQAEALAKKNHHVDEGKALWNLVLIPFLGVGALDTTDRKALADVPMPDEWLQAVASLKDVSKTGIRDLAAGLTDKGFVSVLDALEFVRREESVRAVQKHEVAVAEQLENLGCVMLLARAEKEAPGTLAKIAERATEAASAAVSAASFAVEKAFVIGKGLGTVAAMLRIR